MNPKNLPPLSERLRVLVELVTPGLRIADVGCDHGYASIWLVNSGRCPSCLALDVRPGPLAAARKNVEAYDAAAHVQVRLSDGLKAVKAGEADGVLIAGMGGSLMIRILTEGAEILKGVRALILEPQSDAAKVRRYLTETGFRIEEEALVTECGKYYPAIRAVPAEEVPPLSEVELLYGPCLLRAGDPVLREYLKKERRRFQAIAETLEKTAAPANAERLKEIEKELERIRIAEHDF